MTSAKCAILSIRLSGKRPWVDNRWRPGGGKGPVSKVTKKKSNGQSVRVKIMPEVSDCPWRPGIVIEKVQYRLHIGSPPGRVHRFGGRSADASGRVFQNF